MAWEQTRHIMWSVLVPHQKKGSNLKPTDVLKLDWDNETLETITPEQQAQQLLESKNFWEKVDKKRNGETNS